MALDPPTRKRASTSSYECFTDRFVIPAYELLKNGKRAGYLGESWEYSDWLEVAARPEFPQFGGLKLQFTVTVDHGQPLNRIDAKVQQVEFRGGYLDAYVKASVKGGRPTSDLSIVAYDESRQSASRCADSNRSGTDAPCMLNPAGTFHVAVEAHLDRPGPAAKKKAVEGPTRVPLDAFPDAELVGTDGVALPIHSYLVTAASGALAALVKRPADYKPLPISVPIDGPLAKVLRDFLYHGDQTKIEASLLIKVWSGAGKYGLKGLQKLAEKEMKGTFATMADKDLIEYFQFGKLNGLHGLAAAATAALHARTAAEAAVGASSSAQESQEE